MTLPNAFTSFLQLIRAPAVISAASNIVAAQLIVTDGRPLWSDTLLLVAISTCLFGRSTPAILATVLPLLLLPLLVFGIRTDYPQHTSTPDYFASFTNWFDTYSNLHFSSP